MLSKERTEKKNICYESNVCLYVTTYNRQIRICVILMIISHSKNKLSIQIVKNFLFDYEIKLS